MTRADALQLEALAKKLERKVDRWVARGYRTDAPKVANARALANALRRVLNKAGE